MSSWDKFLLIPVFILQSTFENLKRSRGTVIFLPVYKISSLKITPPKTPNSGQFSYPLPNIVSFLFRLEQAQKLPCKDDELS
jgi:hypothetical protein